MDEQHSGGTELEYPRRDVSVIAEQVRGGQQLNSQRWSDHEAVHSKDGEALDKALVRTETAIDAASGAHRREHEIEKSAKEAADAAHQEQHVALNELRNVVGDLTGQYVRIDTLAQTNDNWERRQTEAQKQFQEYRDATAKEQAAYRESVTKGEAEYRAQQSAEIRSLRESRSLGAGHHEGTATLWGYIIGAAGLVGVLVTIAFKLAGH